MGYVNTRGFAINTAVEAAKDVACGRDHLPLVYKHVSDFSEEERELAQAIFSQRAKPYKKPATEGHIPNMEN